MTPTSTSPSVLAEHISRLHVPAVPPINGAPLSRPTIGFIVWPQSGHIFPTLTLARRLIKKGFTVRYFSSDHGASIVRSQGFECDVISPEPEAVMSLPDAERTACMIKLIDTFTQLLNLLGVVRLYTDPLLFFAGFAGLRRGIPVEYTWTLEPPIARNGHLPQPLPLSLNRSWISRIGAQYLWRIPTRNADRDIKTAEAKGEGQFHALFLRLCAEFGLRSVLSSFGYIPVLPSLVLAPSALLPIRDKSVRYLGFCIDFERAEPAFPKTRPGRLVYCTFGNNFLIYPGAARILDEILSVAKEMVDFSFLIQVPSAYSPKESLPTNVILADAVPTLRVLQKASAIICHGGLGNIKESVFFQVPILAIPFFYDQPANAATLERNGVGLALAPEEATAATIKRDLQKLLSRARFSATIADVRSRCLNEGQEEQWAEELSRLHKIQASIPATSPA